MRRTKEEVVLTTSASTETSVAHLWDIRTGTLLVSYKNCACAPHAFCLIGSDFFASVQAGKSAVHIWDWRKDQPQVKCTGPEKIHALAATSDGVFLVGGGSSGKLYAWEIASGELLRTFDAHYKAVTTLCFTDDGSVLVSGGEDGLVNVWLMTELVDQTLSRNQRTVSPLHSWSDHTLQITGLFIGAGGISARLLSCSMDRTCRIWHIPSGTQLACIAFPSAVTSVAMDLAETHLYAGANSGLIYEVDLFQPVPIVAGDSSGSQQMFKGHSHAISSLALSSDGSALISGAADGVRVWDTYSHQVTKIISHHQKGMITNVAVLPKPNDLEGNQKLPSFSTLKTPKRYLSEEQPADVSVLLRDLKTLDQDRKLSLHSGLDIDVARMRMFVEVNEAKSATGMETDMAKLQAEVAQLKAVNERWKVLNNEMYQLCVDGIVEKVSRS